MKWKLRRKDETPSAEQETSPKSPLVGRIAEAKGAWTAALIVMAISLLATFTLATPERVEPRLGGADSVLVTETVLDSSSDSVNAADPSDNPASVSTSGGSGGKGPGGRVYDCSKGQNAGATDIGVTAREIRFAATIVTSGVARDFLYDAQFAIEAVRNKVNRSGGICGRIIVVDVLDDGWDPDRGQRAIEGFIGSKKYLGLAVNPSSEGLRGAIDSGLIRNAGFPVIGADGMLIDQYQDPWVWPVATSTSSVMHIMAQNALARGAKKFGIVWETNYRFGVEGHEAFVAEVERGGGVITSDKGIQKEQPSYKNSVDEFMKGCGGVDSLNECDFIAMLLEPNTASQWVRDGGLGNGTVRPSVGIGAPQPLFLDSFARDCGKFCANMWVWTSFKPPIPPFDTEKAVAVYRNDLLTYGGSSKADPNNPHVQGAYVGMTLLVEALRKLGPTPTRAGMKGTLDSMKLETGLAPPLQFAPGNHFSAISAQAFEAIVQGASWQTWRYTQSGFINDRSVGKDISR